MKKLSSVIKTAAIIYAIAMIWLLFIQRMPIELPKSDNYAETLIKRINLVPFRTISEYMKSASISDLFLFNSEGNPLINLIGNIIVFIPMGFFMCCIWKKPRNFSIHLPITLAVILLIEAIQLFTFLGSFDIDDIILNTLGAATGYIIYKTLKLISDKSITGS